MNFSRYVYLEALCNFALGLNKRTLKKCLNNIVEEIDSQIQSIYNKAQGGYWGICNGDKTFIHYLEKLKEALQEKRVKHIKELLYMAYSFSERKIKVVFFVQDTSVWPSLQSAYYAGASDERFAVKLVYIPFQHENSDLAEDYLHKYHCMGLPILKHTEYSLTEDNPDVAIFVKPYDLIPDQFYIDDVDKVVRRCVYIPYGMEIGNSIESIRYQYKLILHYRAWKILCYSEQYYKRARIYSYKNARNYLKIGHPRFDLIDIDLKNDQTVKHIQKLSKGRKIFLWNTHFTLDQNSTWGSYMVWGESILEYVKNHKDIFLIWRPHPLFFKALEKAEGMNSDKASELFASISQNENIYLDKSESYLSSFYISDAMISDASSLVPEYLVWGKPILYTPKPNGQGFFDEEIYELLYVVNSEIDISDFFDQIKKGIDIKKDERENNLDKHFILQNKGMVGKSLFNYIASEIVLEETNAVQQNSCNKWCR